MIGEDGKPAVLTREPAPEMVFGAEAGRNESLARPVDLALDAGLVVHLNFAEEPPVNSHASILLHYLFEHPLLAHHARGEGLREIEGEQATVRLVFTHLPQGSVCALVLGQCVKPKPHLPLVLRLKVKKMQLLLLDIESVFAHVPQRHREEVAQFIFKPEMARALKEEELQI